METKYPARTIRSTRPYLNNPTDPTWRLTKRRRLRAMAAPDSRLALTPNYAQWPKVTDHPQVGEAEIYHVKVKPDPCPNDQRTAGPSSKALPVTPRKNVVSQPRNPPDDLQVIFAPRSYPDVVFDTPTAILGPDQNPDFPLRGPHAPKPRRTDALHTHQPPAE